MCIRDRFKSIKESFPAIPVQTITIPSDTYITGVLNTKIEDYITTVSYTHLDVYKRQYIDTKQKRKFVTMGNKRILNFMMTNLLLSS